MTYRTQQRRKALYQALVKCLGGSLLVTTLLSPSLAQEQGGVGKPQRIPTWASESARRYRPEFYQPQGQQDRIDLPAAVANAQLFVPPAPSVSPNYGGDAQLPDPRYALQPPATSVTVPATNGPFVPAPLPQPNATSVAYQHEQPVRLPAPNDNPLPASEATESVGDPAYYGSPYAYAAQCGCDDFAPTPIPNGALVHDPCAAQNAYDNKQYVPTQRPWLELGFPFYGPGTLPPSSSAFSFFNPIRQKFYLYGDLRTGVGAGKNAVADTQNWAARLNLDADWQLTPTGRLHGGFQPLTQGVQFTRVEFGQNSEFVQELNPTSSPGFSKATWVRLPAVCKIPPRHLTCRLRSG